MMFTKILTCSTRHEKKQILDHVIHDILPVQKHVSACFGERHQNHCFLIVVLTATLSSKPPLSSLYLYIGKVLFVDESTI